MVYKPEDPNAGTVVKSNQELLDVASHGTQGGVPQVSLMALKFDTNIDVEEFTMLTPSDKGNHPVFARLTVQYEPNSNREYLNLLSFRKYLNTYRNFVLSYEHSVAMIFYDLWRAMKPKMLKVKMDFSTRGGIAPKIELDSCFITALNELDLDAGDSDAPKIHIEQRVKVGHSVFETYDRENQKDILDIFLNSHTRKDYQINFLFPEFTSLCPTTKQPDYATIDIIYVPKDLCVELKSLKQYYWSYRNKKMHMEDIVNCIRDDIVKVISPKQLVVGAVFQPRGGIHHDFQACYPYHLSPTIGDRV